MPTSRTAALSPSCTSSHTGGGPRLLVAGLGSIGERHVRNLRALGGCELSVYRQTDRPPRTIQEASLRVFREWEEALAQRPTAVLITNPTHLHVPLALEAARRGIHLFIDIPLSHDVEGTLELEQLVESKRLVSLMGFNLRFHPCIRAVRELIQQGAVGRTLAVHAECGSYLPAWHPWEDYRVGYAASGAMGGGALLAAGVHELDAVGWLLGPVVEVECVEARDGVLELRDAEEAARLTFRFDNGAIGQLSCDLIQRPASRWGKVVGTEGTVTWDILGCEVRLYRTQSAVWESVLQDTGFDYNLTYVEQMRHFLRCLGGLEEPINPVAQGRQTLAVALAAKRAARSGARVRVATEEAGNGRG